MKPDLQRVEQSDRGDVTRSLDEKFTKMTFSAEKIEQMIRKHKDTAEARLDINLYKVSQQIDLNMASGI